MSLLTRDPFARTELHKTKVTVSRGCDFCGRKLNTGMLYRFRTESDGGRSWNSPGLFCSKSCHDTYNS